MASQILHLNCPGGTSGFIVLTIVYLRPFRYNYPCLVRMFENTDIIQIRYIGKFGPRGLLNRGAVHPLACQNSQSHKTIITS